MSWASIAAETPGLIRLVEAYKPPKTTTPQSTLKRLSGLYRANKAFKPSSLTGDEAASFTAGWAHIEALRQGPIARILDGKSPHSKDEAGNYREMPGGFMSHQSWRVLEDYSDKLRLYLRVYGYSKAAQYMAEFWPAFLPRMATSYTPGAKVIAKLAGLEDPGTLRSNYVGALEVAKSFYNTDASPLETGMMLAVLSGNLMAMRDNERDAACARAIPVLERIIADTETRMATFARAKGLIDWTYWYQYLQHPVTRTCEYMLTMYHLTGREGYLAAFHRIGAQLAASWRYARLKDGTEVVMYPHNVPEAAGGIGLSSEEMADVDTTYHQEKVPGDVFLCDFGSPYHTERFLRAIAHSSHRFPMVEGYAGKALSETMGGSYKDRSLEGGTVRVTADGERVDFRGGKVERMTSRAPGITWRRGLHFLPTAFTGHKPYLTGLDTAIRSGGQANHIVKLLFYAVQRGAFRKGKR